ncbi:MAG: hypothetical protein GY737_18960 [Desulfobacteraceae bacterium]|nr:hypothetical protein [Desulfobacteraceae bacterium]
MTTDVTLADVLFVPGLSCNLVSVRAVLDRGKTVHFSSSGCVIKTADGKTIASARREDRLFKLNLKTSWSFEEERQRSDGLRGPPTKKATTSRSLETAGGDATASQERRKAPPVPNLDADEEVACGIDCDAALDCYEDDN